ncbi:MAG: LysR family transcriptional regulator [Vulcanimicrobiaceae bacterium]
MDVRQLRYVLALARRRSFTLAAADLSIAQPALSQQIARLERELGVRLFDRTNRRVSLTDAGSALALRAERIIADVAAAAEEMSSFSGGLRGRVVLGTYQSFSEYTLPKLLGRFHALYPGIEIALREGLADELLAQLRSGNVDAFIGDPGDAGDTPAQEFVIEALYDDELVIALAAMHPHARASHIELGELRDERWVIFRPGSSLTARLYTLARAAGFVPLIAFESADSMTVRSLVAEGLGVALFPRALGNTPGPNVALVSLAPQRLVRHMSLVTRRPPYTPSATTFLNFIREQFYE